MNRKISVINISTTNVRLRNKLCLKTFLLYYIVYNTTKKTKLQVQVQVHCSLQTSSSQGKETRTGEREEEYHLEFWMVLWTTLLLPNGPQPTTHPLAHAPITMLQFHFGMLPGWLLWKSLTGGVPLNTGPWSAWLCNPILDKAPNTPTQDMFFFHAETSSLSKSNIH